MEQHGEIPIKNVIAIIPARYGSTRLPGKLLLPIAGDPLILHTARRATETKTVSRVIVATDDGRIFEVVEKSGFEAVMTSALHRSGSDRIAEVAETLPEASIIVNVQGDEPVISPETIDRAVEEIFSDSSADIVTTSEPIDDPADVFDPNIVKVVTDLNKNALYFSRSPVPFPREALSRYGDWKTAFENGAISIEQYRKHTGLYVYRREFVLRFSKMEQTPLEKIEMLEQLRALENGVKIRVVESAGRSIGVDTFDDLERVRRLLENPADSAY